MAKKLNPQVLSGIVAGRSNRYLVGRCEFCNGSAVPAYTTMYGTHICSACHKTLLTYGYTNLAPQEMGSCEGQRFDQLTALNDFAISHPVSRTQQKFEEKSTSLGFIVFFSVVLVLWFAKELSVAAIVLALGGSILVARQYLKEKLQEHASVINSEIEVAEQACDEDRVRAMEQQNNRIENVRRLLFGQYRDRHRMIISKSVERSISLYEYHFSEDPPDWEERRQEVIRRDGSHCHECGITNTIFNIHHKIPRGRGGTHHLSNLVTLCAKCHMRTHGIS